MLYSVKKIINTQAFVLTLQFNTGEIINVNLKQKLQEWSKEPNSIYKKLLDPNYFKTVKYEPEWKTIYWDNGIDLCADVLYEIGKETEEQEIEHNNISNAILLLFKSLNNNQKIKVFNQLKTNYQIK